MGLALDNGWRDSSVAVADLTAAFSQGHGDRYELFSLTTNSDRAAFDARQSQDSRLRTKTSCVGEPQFFDSEQALADLGEVGWLPIGGLTWAYRGDMRPDQVRAKTWLTRVVFKRTVSAPVRSVQYEVIYCRAIPGVDNATLKSGRIPGSVDVNGTSQVKSSRTLGQHKMYLADDCYTSMDLEFHPVSGHVLRLSGCRAGFVASVLRQPAERHALNAILWPAA